MIIMFIIFALTDEDGIIYLSCIKLYKPEANCVDTIYSMQGRVTSGG